MPYDLPDEILTQEALSRGVAGGVHQAVTNRQGSSGSHQPTAAGKVGSVAIWASLSLDRDYMYDQVATPRRRGGGDNDANCQLDFTTTQNSTDLTSRQSSIDETREDGVSNGLVSISEHTTVASQLYGT